MSLRNEVTEDCISFSNTPTLNVYPFATPNHLRAFHSAQIAAAKKYMLWLIKDALACANRVKAPGSYKLMCDLKTHIPLWALEEAVPLVTKTIKAHGWQVHTNVIVPSSTSACMYDVLHVLISDAEDAINKTKENKESQ